MYTPDELSGIDKYTIERARTNDHNVVVVIYTNRFIDSESNAMFWAYGESSGLPLSSYTVNLCWKTDITALVQPRYPQEWNDTNTGCNVYISNTAFCHKVTHCDSRKYNHILLVLVRMLMGIRPKYIILSKILCNDSYIMLGVLHHCGIVPSQIHELHNHLDYLKQVRANDSKYECHSLENRSSLYFRGHYSLYNSTALPFRCYSYSTSDNDSIWSKMQDAYVAKSGMHLKDLDYRIEYYKFDGRPAYVPCYTWKEVLTSVLKRRAMQRADQIKVTAELKRQSSSSEEYQHQLVLGLLWTMPEVQIITASCYTTHIERQDSGLNRHMRTKYVFASCLLSHCIPFYIAFHL